MADLNQEDIGVLERAYEFEKTMPDHMKKLGWCWYDVNAFVGRINKLVVRGFVKVSFKSNKDTRFMLTDDGKKFVESGAEVVERETLAPTNAEPPPAKDISNMFNDIIGYDDIKELLRESLQLDRPIHVLLVGPPALAKSMFLWDIERTYGSQVMPLLGSATSHAGLWDLLSTKKPRIVLVDEIEKMGLTDMAGLLSLMQTGRIIRAKVGREIDEQLNCWVVAAANRTSKMPPELLSRFAKCFLKEYNAAEFRQVVINVLSPHEGMSEKDASEVAIRLIGKSHDVRDAIRVARLAKRVGVQRSIELLVR